MKIKHKFNVIDILVIIFLLALILGTTFFYLRQSNSIYSEMNEKKISYTVCIRNVDEAHLSSFSKGEPVLDSSSLKQIGTVSEVVSKKSVINGTSAVPGEADGEYILKQTESANLYDVYITISAKAYPDSRGVYYVSSRRIVTGASVYIRCGNYAAQSFVTEFSIS
jgi:hypothetical protein